MTDWLIDRLPLVRMTKTRSPSLTKRYILRQTLTWSNPAFDRESEAITSPSRRHNPQTVGHNPSRR